MKKILSYKEQHLRSFLMERPAINVSEIENICSVPSGTLGDLLQERREISQEYYTQIVSELHNYGFIELDSE